MSFLSEKTMIPSESPFFLTDKLANYVQERFKWYLKSIPHVTGSPGSDAYDSGSFPPMFTHAEPGPLPPLDLSVELVCDCELLAAIAAKAYMNRGMGLTTNRNLPIWWSENTDAVKLNAWDAQRYDASLPKKPMGRNEADEERMKKRYPINEDYNDQPINEPAIVVDRHGKILVWYLPGALSKARQVWFQSRIPDLQRIDLKAL